MSRQAEAFLQEIQVLVFHEAVSFQWICLTGTWTVCSQSLTSCHHYSSRGSPTLHLSAHTLCLQTVVTFRDISPCELCLSLQMMAAHYHYLKLFYRDDLPRIQMEVVSSGAQLCPTLCDPMDYSTPGFPVHHQLPELAQTQVHRVSEAIQPSHPPSSPSPPAFNLAQHQGIFQWVSSLHQVSKRLEF